MFVLFISLKVGKLNVVLFIHNGIEKTKSYRYLLVWKCINYLMYYLVTAPRSSRKLSRHPVHENFEFKEGLKCPTKLNKKTRILQLELPSII